MDLHKFTNYASIAISLYHIAFGAALVHKSLIFLIFSLSLETIQYNYQPGLLECMQTALDDQRAHYDDVRKMFKALVIINIGILIYFIGHVIAALMFLYGIRKKNCNLMRLLTSFMVMDVGISRYLGIYIRYDFWDFLNHYETKMETLQNFPNQMALPILWSILAIIIIKAYVDTKRVKSLNDIFNKFDLKLVE